MTESGAQLYEVRVNYVSSNGACQLSASVRVRVITPNQYTLTAQQQIPQVKHCIEPGSSYRGLVFGVGCVSDSLGIIFNASLSVQGVTNFISSMNDAKIVFVQLANPYSIGSLQNEGTQCATARNPAENFESGWFNDGGGPYSSQRFNENGTATFTTNDSPNARLQFLNYLYTEHFYEMYLVYATGNPDQPRFSKTFAKIPWNWGGEVFFTSTGTAGTHTRFPTNDINHTSIAVNSIRQYNHNYSQVLWDDCPPSGQSPPPDTNIYVEGVGWGWP